MEQHSRYNDIAFFDLFICGRRIELNETICFITLHYIHRPFTGHRVKETSELTKQYR